MSTLRDPDTVWEASLSQWTENGVDQLSLALFLCASGSIFLLRHVLAAGSMLGRNYAMVAPFLQMTCSLAMVVTIKQLRGRLIVPRTGYAVLRRAPSQKWTVLAAIGVMVAFGLAAIWWPSTLRDIGSMIAPVFALVLAACFLWGALRCNVQHWMWLAALSVILGLWTYRTGAPVEWLLVGIGGAMAVTGALQLRTFLKTHPILEDRHE